MEERIPPQDLEAEQSVLGAMMLSKDIIILIAGKLKPDYFYRNAHSEIFQAIIALYQKNEPVDLVTVSAELKKRDMLEATGGRVYLAEVLDSVPSAANADHYANIVLEKALLRKLIDAGSEIVKDALEDNLEVDDMIESAQKTIMDISKERVQEDFVKLKDILMPVMDSIEKVYDTDNKILGIPTGFKDLDALTSGLQPSDLIILAARPAMGKTTLAMNIALNAATMHKVPVAVFSLEMPKEQLAFRLLATESRIDSSRLKTANLLDHEYKDLTRALGKLSETPIFVDDTPAISPLELRAKTRRLQMECDLGLIVIDYLQLMRLGKKRIESRFQEVSEIVRDIKAFARECRVPIIALSQLSRDVEKRQDGPKLSDLRESGEIEQTADLVLFIHREDYYATNTDKASHAKLLIAKHRNGPTGAVDLVFRKDISRFYSSDKSHATPPQAG